MTTYPIDYVDKSMRKIKTTNNWAVAVVHLQMQQVGREMQDNGEDRMQRLMETCRTKIISEKWVLQ